MDPQELIHRIDTLLAEFETAYGNLTLREKVLRLVDILKTTKALGVSVVRADGCDARDARERIRLYLVANVGVTLSATELEVVAGISEYGRRIRELRVEKGYKIITGASNDPEGGLTLKPTEYLLLRAEPDRDSAHRWHSANEVRKLKIGAQDKILRFLQDNVNHVVTTEELRYVAQVSEYGRRTRELRTEQGYAIATRFTGRPDLKQGEYILEDLDRIAPPHDRHIPYEVQKEVYARDNNTCRNCGWNRDKWTRKDPRFLELHHLKEHAFGGANDEPNLLVLCNDCHDKVHSGRIKLS
jgi:hypothetical protein